MKKKTIIITLCLIAAVVTGAACMLYVHTVVKSDEEGDTLVQAKGRRDVSSVCHSFRM